METTPRIGQSPLGGAELLGGRYRLGERLGAGGMATIFRARDEALDRDVAVKVLHAHLIDDETLRQRFRTEARHAASLLHPNIVNVFDQGFDEALDGLPYIVMEHVAGPSLREVLSERGRLTPGEALAVLEPVCRGLVRAHGLGVVHRDVKPENILIAPDGSPKIADFGIARAVAETGHTQTGALIGSIHYIAPELVDGKRATGATDQYALGVMAFELVTGRKPLPGDSPMVVAARHAQERIPPPGDFVSDCSSAFDKAITRATHPEPARRYADLSEFAGALIEAVPGGAQPVELEGLAGHDDRTVVIPAAGTETITMNRPGLSSAGQRPGTPRRRRTPRRARRGGRRSRARRGTASPAHAASEASPAEAPPEEPRGETPEPAPAKRRRGRRRGPRRAMVALLLLALVGAGAFVVWNYGVAPVTTVPAVAELPEADAAAQLESHGLEMVVDERRNDFEAPKGTVLDQAPPEGGELRRGGTVGVVVSAGPAEVTMPDVVGTADDEALQRLESDDYRFVVNRDYEHSPTTEAGTVQAQAPPPGTELRQGDTVIINTSLGVRQVTVPDLSGMDRDEALEALEEADLQGEVAFTYSDAVPTEGRVVTQSVDPGAEVDEHSTVTVTISQGSATIEIPDVEGDGVSEGVEELEEAGFATRVIEEPRPQLGPFRRGETGRVEAQDPQPGKSAERGSQVDLYTFSEAAEDGED